MLEIEDSVQPHPRSIEVSGSQVFLHFYHTKGYHQRYITNVYNGISYYSFFIGDLSIVRHIQQDHIAHHTPDTSTATFVLLDTHLRDYYPHLNLPEQFTIRQTELLLLLDAIVLQLNTLIGFDMQHPRQSKTNIHFNYAIYSTKIVLLLEIPQQDVEKEQIYVDEDILKKLESFSQTTITIKPKKT